MRRGLRKASSPTESALRRSLQNPRIGSITFDSR